MLLPIIPVVYLNRHLPQIIRSAQRAKRSLALPRKRQYLKPALAPRSGRAAPVSQTPKWATYRKTLVAGIIAVGVSATVAKEIFVPWIQEGLQKHAEKSQFLYLVAGERNTFKNNRGYYEIYPNVYKALLAEAETATNGQRSLVLDNATLMITKYRDGLCEQTTLYVQPALRLPPEATRYGWMRVATRNYCSTLDMR